MQGLSLLEARDLGPCCVCAKPLGETGYPMFFRMEFDGHLVDVARLRDAHQASFLEDVGNQAAEDGNLMRWMDKRVAMLCVRCMLERFPELVHEVKPLMEASA